MGAPEAAGIWKDGKKIFYSFISFFQAKEVAEQVLLSVLDTLGLAQLKSALRCVFPELLIAHCPTALASLREKIFIIN